MSNSVEKIAVGGGCHWCTEAVFQALKGVEKVEQGYVASDPPFEEFSEEEAKMIEDKLHHLGYI